MIKLDLKNIKALKTRLDNESKEIIDEFIQVCNETNDINELDEYVDLLLGVAEEISEDDQKIIYDLIDIIQNEQA